MDHYMEFKILPDPEFPTPILMNALFLKLHRVLVQLDNKQLGISFPKVQKNKPSLGDHLRIHGCLNELKQLQAQNWLTGMRDHIEVKEIASVPDNAQHCRIQRIQIKSNAERLRRRYAKRHPEESEEEIMAKFPDSKEKRSKLPYLRIKSQSTGQQFCLFLRHHLPQEEPTTGLFNSYGLSAEATVPWF